MAADPPPHCTDPPPHFLSRLLGGVFLPGRVLEQLGVDVFRWDLNVAHDGTAHKARFERRELRVPFRLHHRHIQQLDVQVLIDRMQRARQDDVVFELDRHFFANQRFEEGKKNLRRRDDKTVDVSSRFQPLKQ